MQQRRGTGARPGHQSENPASWMSVLGADLIRRKLQTSCSFLQERVRRTILFVVTIWRGAEAGDK